MNNKIFVSIICVVWFVIGFVVGWWIAPERVEKIVEVEVEKIIELPAGNESIYSYCVRQARTTLYSSWNGEPKEGTTPENTQSFIDDCFTKLAK